MSGLHGKNAELRISVSEQAYTSIPLTRVGSTRVFRAASNRQNWKWGQDLAVITVDHGGVTEEIDPDGPFVHYPAGAISLPPDIDIATVSGITANALVMNLAGVSAKPGCTRKFDVRIENQILDATCMGATFKSKVMGIPDWKGTLDGLYVDQDMWGLAIAGVSGITPRKILRFRPDPLHAAAYFQGTVIFPSHEMSAGFDALEEEKIAFEGDGPLQAIDKDGNPIFPNI